MADDSEFAAMDDPAFLAERRHVREEPERTPAPSEELVIRYQRLNDEFIRRARAAWASAS